MGLFLTCKFDTSCKTLGQQYNYGKGDYENLCKFMDIDWEPYLRQCSSVDAKWLLLKNNSIMLQFDNSIMLQKAAVHDLCGGLSWLPVSFLLHVKYTLSYRKIEKFVPKISNFYEWRKPSWKCHLPMDVREKIRYKHRLWNRYIETRDLHYLINYKK